MPRIYTEIRISHQTQEQKETLETLLDEQSKKLFGTPNRAEYIRLIISLDTASGIIEKLKERKV